MKEPERYRTVRRIGLGGMAEIFEAVATGSGGFHRRVAIKRMLPEFGQDAHFSSMFLDEARIASHLQHANIVAVLDYGIAQGVPFQVLEYVDGIDLHRLRRQPADLSAKVPPDVALYVCTEIGHALAHAHAALDENGKKLGIVHRDVKPSNILLSWSGEVKLTDFGIAFAREKLERTVVGKVKGTLNYMAPEQVMCGAIDGRADLFALGCVLHELLLGRSAVEGATLGSLLQGHEVDVDPSLDEDLRLILIRALRFSKVQRFSSRRR